MGREPCVSFVPSCACFLSFKVGDMAVMPPLQDSCEVPVRCVSQDQGQTQTGTVEPDAGTPVCASHVVFLTPFFPSSLPDHRCPHLSCKHCGRKGEGAGNRLAPLETFLVQ